MRPAVRRMVIANLLLDCGPLSLRELGAKLSLDQNTILRNLSQMEEEGIVSKTENEGWRRRPTKTGRYKYSYRLEQK